MPASQAMTEIIILHLKKGVIIEDEVSTTGVDTGPAKQAFIQSMSTVKAQPGFIRQFWGHQCEDPHIFVWSIGWESWEHNAAFVNSQEHISLMTGMDQVFDLEVAAPLTTYIHFTDDPSAAFIAPVTEIAFFTLPHSDREAAKPIIENDPISSTHPVITVGKSQGGATGWVSDTKNPGNAVRDGESIALLGVFGYSSVDDHVKWRQTPEHAQLLEDMGKTPFGQLALGEPTLPGGNTFIPDSSIFHVEFHAGM